MTTSIDVIKTLIIQAIEAGEQDQPDAVTFLIPGPFVLLCLVTQLDLKVGGGGWVQCLT